MILYVILLSLFLLVLIVEDIRSFEIDFAALTMVALAGFCLNLYLGIPFEDMVVGCVVWGLSGLAIRYVMGRRTIGQGDLWLLPVMGLLAGLGGSLSASLVFCLISLVTARSYQLARPKKNSPRRFSRYPGALPGGLTIFFIFIARFSDININLGMTVLRNSDWSENNAALRINAVEWSVPVAALTVALAVAVMILDRRRSARGDVE
ncbi:prepilin peptidase [uncultured Ruegeria sp.]|uniref:prepilin peptidase n=1 Tax=uncultured Ruegeria sp. TaxID=259304 RepID=UPI002627E630|nr:prepilin peptidase [uncultured Ruegeria sp.]